MGVYLQRAILVVGLTIAATALTTPSEAQGVGVGVATAEQKQTAQKHYLAAMEHFNAKRFDKSYEGFAASYAVVASPNSHLMMARSLRDGGKTLEAYREFDRVIEEAVTAAAQDAKYKETEQAARTEARAMRASLALVTLSLTGAAPDVRVTVGGQPIDRPALGTALPLLPGEVAIVVSAPGKTDVQRSLRLAAGTEETVSIDLSKEWAPPAPPPAAPVAAEAEVSGNTMGLTKRQWAYVAGGVGAAGVVTFGVFGLMNNARYNDLQDSCPNGQCPPDRSGDIDSGKRYQTIANIGLVVGVVGLGTGTTLYLMSRGEQKPAAADSAVPEVAVGPGSVLVRGQF